MNGKPRTVFHVDMDTFFVSVERLYDPSLIGKPVVVGGRPDQRGVVSAASYEARKYGVHSAMPLRTAYRLCPQAIFVDGHPNRYREHSQRVRDVLHGFSPQVEMASIDEAYIEVTGTERLHGAPLKAAQKLHDAIYAKTRLNSSIGVASSRLVAKISSDQAKPNGVLWVLPGLEARFLAPLDVRKIPGVGKVTEAQLQLLGIRRIGDLARLDEQFLAGRFGKWGLALAGKAQGLDAGGWFDCPIGSAEGPKSISHEHTYNEDTADREQLDASLAQLTEMVARRLRDHQLYARTVQLKLRYSDFSTFTRAHTIEQATQLDTVLLAKVRSLFAGNWSGKPIRLLGVQAGNLEDSEGQMSLLDQQQSERWSKAMAAADALRDRFGEQAVSLAASLKGRFRERVHENPAAIPGKKLRQP